MRVFYAHDGPNRLDRGEVTPREIIERAVAIADLTVSSRAAALGGVRHLRLDTPRCRLRITPLRVAYVGNASLNNAVDALIDEGHIDPLVPGDKALVVGFTRTGDANCFGNSQLFDDDRPGRRNVSNVYPTVSYVGCGPPAALDASGWTPGTVVAHELLHGLGAVQTSAPHSTGAGHCSDGSDILCYVDRPGTVVDDVCAPARPATIDCGADDYFAIRPARGSYLDTHWNTARSRWLDRAEPPRWHELTSD